MTGPVQRIGELLQSQIFADTKQTLLYAEIQDGVIESALFLELESGTVLFRFLTDALEDALYDFWECGDGNVAPCSWRAIEYCVANAGFDIRFTHPSDFDEALGALDRRPQLLQRYFPGAKVDYSNPG